MKQAIHTKFRKLYDFYTSDLTIKDIEKLVVRDVPELYDFYARKIKTPDASSNRIKRTIHFIKNLFAEFLEQLAPVRRLIFTVSVFIFIISYFNNNWQWAGISFIMVCLLLAFELADKLTAKDELALARKIQQSFMPKEAPLNKYYDIGYHMENAREVGGDYFDFITEESLNHNDGHVNSENKLFVVIGDVSGKGMAAAIHMIQVQSILRHSVLHYKTPKEILFSMNKNLRKILDKRTFFTTCISSINSDGSILLSRAGHMPLLYYKSSEDKFFKIVPKGIGIGIADDKIFNNTLEEIYLKPEQNDILTFYTDGVIEARNYYRQEFGEERLKSIIRSNRDKPAAEIKDSVINIISNFISNTPQHDDYTLVILKSRSLFRDL